ncbi:MAG: response regulator transcription factor [Saprospiraceae bacterium]|jgi:DNA-binding NarL/FixJ family response regulator
MVITNSTIDVSILDDDLNILHSINEVLSTQKNMTLRWAGSDYNHFKQHGLPKTDILLLDILMEGIVGTDLIEELKKINPSVNIIMYSVIEDVDVLFTCISNGADGYLLKNSSIDELIKTIQCTYDGGSNISPMMARKLFHHFKKSRDSKFENILNEHEYQVLKLLSEGFSYKIIGSKLDITLDSVRYYIKGVYKKLNVNSKGEAIIKFIGKS